MESLAQRKYKNVKKMHGAIGTYLLAFGKLRWRYGRKADR